MTVLTGSKFVEEIKTYKEIFGRKKVKSLRFVDGNFEQCEEFVGGDCNYNGKTGIMTLAAKQGPLKVKDGQHIIKHSENFFQIMDYLTLRGGYEMERSK